MQVLGLPLSCFVLLLVTKLALGLSEQTCTLELDCISQGWIGDPPSFRMFTLSAISDAIGEPVNRFDLEFPQSSSSLVIKLQVLPRPDVDPSVPSGDTGSPVTVIVDHFKNELDTPSSKLRTGSLSRLLAGGSPRSVSYADPARAGISPAYITYSLKSLEDRVPMSFVTVSNTGGSDLLVSGMFVAGSSPWLTVSPKSFVVSPGGFVSVSISIDLSLVPPTLQTAPLFRTLELRDNVPDGPHTVGILLELSPQGPVVGFGAGVALGAGLVSLALIFVYCIKRRYCTRKVSSSVPVEPSTISSSTRPNHHRPNTAQFAKLDTVDAASSEIASLSAGGGEGDIEMASRPAPAVQILTTPGALSLVPNPSLRPEEFDTKWQSLLTCEIWGASAVVPLPSEGAIEAELARVHIRCLASGALGDVHKFYFYAEDTSAVLFLVELSLSSTSNRFSALVKSAAQDKGSAFADIIKRALRDFILL